MEEWSKILLSTLGGFAAGIISQPLTFYIGAILRRNALKSELYQDLGRVYYALVRYRTLVDNRTVNQPQDIIRDPGLMLECISSELFDDVITSEKALIRGMPEYDGFKILYVITARIREAISCGTFYSTFPEHEQQFYAAADELTKAGILDSGRLYNAARTYRRRMASRTNRLYRT